MGVTSEIKLCFDLCYNEKMLTRPETGIWKPYFVYKFNEKGINIVDVDIDEYVNHMAEMVEIYCINNIEPYKLKICNRIETRMGDVEKTTKDYLLFGCDYK
jgi:hypothetical protein